jgi:hypothetical protein
MNCGVFSQPVVCGSKNQNPRASHGAWKISPDHNQQNPQRVGETQPTPSPNDIAAEKNRTGGEGKSPCLRTCDHKPALKTGEV